MENAIVFQIGNGQPTDEPKRFSYGDLKRFTKDFDTKLGSGGFGTVYKGEFPNGVQIAVKVLTEKNVTEELFMEEVRLSSMTSHQNLIQLYGFCCDSNTRGLVYEYMENRSLDGFLYKEDLPIEWDKLYEIMTHIAIGISHLHDGCMERIIHYDIKPANILLDSNFTPKVADFGLAKLMSKDVSHVTLSGPIGTRGFVAPEMWLPFSHVTYKCDVYSYSMLLFEVLRTGSAMQHDEWFPRKVWKEVERKQLDKFIEDCGIKGKDKENAKILTMVALWCAQFTPERRPSMNNVVKMLKKEIQVTMPPNPFLASSDSTTPPSREGHEDAVSGTKLKSLSDYEKSILLVKFATKDNGFIGHGIPVTAVVIYKCLLHWNSFESENTCIFDSLIAMISKIVYCPENKDSMHYWMSNTSMLLYFLECSFKDTGTTQQIRNTFPGKSIFSQIFWKIYLGFREAPLVEDVEDIEGFIFDDSYLHSPNFVFQVEAKPEAFHFKEELTTYVQILLETIGEQLKKDLRPFINLCIHEPRISRLSGKSGISSDNHWQSIIDILNTFLVTMEKNFVPSLLIHKIVFQTFSYINTQIFNSLMLRSECCSLSYGYYVKEGLDKLERWCLAAKEEYTGSSWCELKHIRQAVGLLVLSDKPKISMDQITLLCPDLSMRQLHQICTNYRDDENGTPGLSDGIISQMMDHGHSSFMLKASVKFPFFIYDLFSFLRNVDFQITTLDAELLKYPFLME